MNEPPLQLQPGDGDLNLKAARFIGVALSGQIDKVNGVAREGALGHTTRQYAVSIADSISRILTTRLGERVMRPEFGSNLYLLRDRDFDGRWRVTATRYIYEAISRWEPRVRFKRLRFNIDATSGQHTFYLELEPNA